MSLKKRYLKSKPVCKVTFVLPKESAGKARQVNLVGEFNNWDPKATPMQGMKSGAYKVTLDLPRNNAFQFRYLLNQTNWQNDEAADRYVPNGLGDADNSVVIV